MSKWHVAIITIIVLLTAGAGPFIYSRLSPALPTEAGSFPQGLQQKSAMPSNAPTTDGSLTAQRNGNTETPTSGTLPGALTESASTASIYKIKQAGVYCDGNLLLSADAKTFSVVYSIWTDSPVFNFAKDSSHVYSECSIISGADPASFSLINNDEGWTYAAKDKNHVYYDANGSKQSPAILLVEADPATITVFGDLLHGYAKDKNHVYRYDYQTGEPSILIVADPATFMPMCKPSSRGVCNFAEDTRHVFYQATVVPGVDPATFSLLCFPPTEPDDEYSCYYGKDKDHVFVLTGDSGNQTIRAIVGADPLTFTLVYTGQPCGPGCFIDAQDLEHRYASGRIIY
jgi:DKNYY family